MSRKSLAAVVLFILVFYAGVGRAQIPMVMESGSTKSEDVRIPENATPEQIGEILGGMSDEQVRRVFLSYLKKEAAAQQESGESTGIHAALQAMRAKLKLIRDRVEYVFSGAELVPALYPKLLGAVDPAERQIPFGRLMAALVVLTSIWFAVKWLFHWLTSRLRRDINATPRETGWFIKAGRLSLRLCIDFGTMLAVMILLGIVYMLVFHDPMRQRPVLLVWILAVLLHELFRMAARFLLSPKAPALRLLPVSDRAAVRMFNYAEIIGCELGLGLVFVGIVQLYGSTEALYLMAISSTGLLVCLSLCIMALANARKGAEALRAAFPPGTIRHRLSKSWHWLTVAYVLVFWAFWVINLLAFGYEALAAGALTLVVVPAYLMLTWVVDRTVIFAGELAQGALLEEGQVAADPRTDFLVDEKGAPMVATCPVARLRRFLHKMFSVVLLATTVLIILGIWGIDLPIARRVAEGALSVLVTLVLAYIFWAVSKAYIEKKLRGQDGEEDEESEEGGAGGDRLTTLLELLKRFIFAVLIVVVVLIVLSSLGVDTGPLLAGAGVFGIAIGFGSQTLVKDIISGVFFLMDDAFRVGDYIQVGNSKGTVEEISVRSMKLRHHLGMLYTIPYGSIHEVRNMTRDWSMMKLEYLVPFDTDIQQVKKIVKEINKEIKAIPELAGGMLTDIKSQGVKAMEEYGMRMRIKFMTKPGSQFTIRKLILAKLRKKFEEQGLQFAYRKVSVALPEEIRADAARMQQVGAAVAQAVEEEEAEAGNKETAEDR